MMPMHPPIMVGVDGSKHAEYALKASIQMAKFRSAKLVITSVYSYPPELGDILGTPDSHLNEASIRLKKTLNGYREQAFKAGVKEVEIKVLTAFSPFMNAGAMLVIEAEKMGCGMIVVGTKGATGIERTLLGSVAGFIVKTAHCDVYVVRN